jgi:diguanylate cyclase (GGDEF)-like protein
MMIHAVPHNIDLKPYADAPWATEVMETAVAIVIVVGAAIGAAQGHDFASVGVWAGILSASYGGLHLLRDKVTPRFELLRQLTVMLLWAGGLIITAEQPSAVVGIALAACLAYAWTSLCANQRALSSATALADALAARTETEASFLRAVDEIRRLRIDVKTTADIQHQITSALTESNAELGVARSKADAFATALQQVMPFEPESGLLNAEKFATVLRREWQRMQRLELPLTMVLMKLDEFELFERTYGRPLYEALLHRLAEILSKAGARPGDIAARLSVDHFALLFPETEERHALTLAEEVRARVQQLEIPNRHAAQELITASLGVATIVPHPEAAPGVLRERAEAALYEASFQGGNRCVRNRIAGFARLERWNSEQEGVVTMERLRHKLAISGYQGKPIQLVPGTKPRERRVNIDSVEAVVAGVLKVTLDGEVRTLNPGDCLYLPKGVIAKDEAIGSEPVVCIEAVKA